MPQGATVGLTWAVKSMARQAIMRDVTTFSSLKPLALVVSGGQLLLTHSHVKLFNILLNYTKRFLFFGQLAGTHFLQWHHKNHKQMPFKGWAQCQALQTRLSSAHRNPTMA